MPRILPSTLDRPWYVRYGLVVILVLVAFGIKLLLADPSGNDPITGGVFVIFSSAVTLSAVYGGLGPGLLATALSGLIGDLQFLPLYGLAALTGGTTTLHTGLFLFDGVLVSVLSGAFHASRRRLIQEVVARTAAEQQAATQRDQLRVTLTSIGDGVIATDAQGNVTFLNGVAEMLTGWPQTDAIGQPIDRVFVIVNEYTRVPVESPIVQVLHEGTIVGLANHTVLIARDGSERPIADSGAPIRDKDAIQGAVLVFRDVTDQRESARELEQRERNYRTLVEQASEAIWVTDSQGRITLINAVGGSLLGYTPDELIGMSVIELLPLEDSAADSHHFTEARQDSTVVWQRQLRRKDGRLITVEGSSHMLSDGRFQAIVRDVTAQQAAGQIERFLAQATLTLTAQLDFTTTLTQLAHLVVPTLADYSVVDVIDSGDAVRRVAVAQADPKQQELTYKLMDYPPDQDRPTGVPYVLQTGEPLFLPDLPPSYIEEASREPAMVAVLTALRPCSAIIAPLTIRGRIFGALSLVTTEYSQRRYTARDLEVATDLAQRAALALDNAQLYSEIQESLYERDQFLSVAAHELRTPLTALTASAQLLQRRAVRTRSMESRDLEAVRRISNQANRLNSLIESLLNLSRIELGQLPISRQPLDLVALTQRVAEEFQLTADEHPIQLIVSSTPLTVLGDDVRLEQVLQNLLQNAVKYSPNNNPITVTVTQQDDHAVVMVQDRGIGIPAAAQAQLFQRFYRAGNVSTQRISGFGIGLYVVKEIVDRHAGTVSVTSEEGKGSTFTVTLPLVAAGGEI